MNISGVALASLYVKTGSKKTTESQKPNPPVLLMLILPLQADILGDASHVAEKEHVALATRGCWPWESGAKGGAGSCFPASFGVQVYRVCVIKHFTLLHHGDRNSEVSADVYQRPLLVNPAARGACRVVGKMLALLSLGEPLARLIPGSLADVDEESVWISCRSVKSNSRYVNTEVSPAWGKMLLFS